MVVERNRTITGKVVTGTQQAAFFTQLGWVKEQCLNKLGFEPYPGTLNLKITPDQMLVSECVRQSAVLKLVPPDDDYCPALIFPGVMGEMDVAIVIPHESARVHELDILEVIAPVHLRKSLALQDGDSIIISICL
jgi:CTP-dependent riboflavin kinase